MVKDGRSSPPGIPFRNHIRLERESSLTSQSSQLWYYVHGLPVPQQDRGPTTAATATSEHTGDTSHSRRVRTPRTSVDLDAWLDSTATAVQQMHEGDAGVDSMEQQHDPMFLNRDRVHYETGFHGRQSVAYTTPCSGGHACASTTDSGDNTGDSTAGSDTPRPQGSNNSVKTAYGPGEEVPQSAYRAGAGRRRPSGSGKWSSSDASV